MQSSRYKTQNRRIPPNSSVGLGEIKNITANPSAQEGSDLVAEWDNAEQRCEILWAKYLANEIAGHRYCIGGSMSARVLLSYVSHGHFTSLSLWQDSPCFDLGKSKAQVNV
jgi:hypothetical protein